MPKIELYNYFRSSCSYRVRIALNLKQLKFKYIPVHLLKNGGEQFAASYLKLNPKAEVPTMIYDDLVLSQSVAIIEYLDEKHPETFPLYPKELDTKAMVRSACEIINSGIQPLQSTRPQNFLQNQFGISHEDKLLWLRFFIQNGLEAYEKLISPYAGKYSFGDTVTAADIFLVPQIFSAQRFDVNMNDYPKLAEIYHHCMQLPEFIAASPEHQPDAQ